MAAALGRGLSAEGYVVDRVADGPAGLEAARFGAYDVVVLDIMLPGMSGYSVVRTLREEENWVPVLLLSAKDGADDYLTKPFSFVVLLARLRSLVRRDTGPRPTVLEAGGLSLDPATHRVQVDGADVELSPREFRLLEQLLRAAPAVISKDELLDQVWASGDDANVVEVYVGYLRRKLGRERIETVRGVGYRVAD